MTTNPEPIVASRSPAARLRLLGAAALVALVAGVAAFGTGGAAAPPPPTEDYTKEPTVGGLKMFGQWDKPDAVLVLSGQTFGYLQPCGCSSPQFGGIERRMVLIDSLKAKGWPVAAVDLGDLYPDRDREVLYSEPQSLLRYKTAMTAMRKMGYVAVGVGMTEFQVEVDKVLGEYALQKEQPPFLLAANLIGSANGKPVPRAQRFPNPPGSQRPMIDATEVAAVGNLHVGVTGLIGKSLAEDVTKKKLDSSVDFVRDAKGNIDNDTPLKQAVAALANHPKKPQLKVLLYQGTAEEAAALAKVYPQFGVILCQAGDAEPPQFATLANDGKTLIVEVGHKGRYVGVVGAFRNAGGGYDLKYQLVPLGPYYITAGAEAVAQKANAILPDLESFSAEVRDRNFLADVKKVAHSTQIAQPKLNVSYVGSARCQGCHQGEHAKWAGTPHSHALDTLEKKAKRPGLRQFDPECVVCHTVGLRYETGFKNEKDTPALKHVGCESCHGPGSGHMANPKNQELLALQSPWRQQPGDKLPPLEFMKKMAEVELLDRNKEEGKLPAGQLRAVNAVAAMCSKCHDQENDPHFNLYKYWPKVNHTAQNPAPAGGGK